MSPKSRIEQVIPGWSTRVAQMCFATVMALLVLACGMPDKKRPPTSTKPAQPAGCVETILADNRNSNADEPKMMIVTGRRISRECSISVSDLNQQNI